MCGIAGAIDLRAQREFPASRLLAMTGAITHRGPDDEHIHIEPGLALGARRLSIVDLSGGRQPLCNEDGSVWVTQNGEIFEYPELQQELLSRGHTLSTRCDTELWVHLYEDLREGMFAKTRGQFAVALWDRKTRTLILGRDRVGICPLHYAEVDGWLLWGSEIKALLASRMIEARPDRKGIDLFFNTFCAGTSRTFFEGIKMIPPGHYLLVRNGRVELKQYWDLDFPDAGSERKLDDPTPLVDELEHLMRLAVERRLRGDVPVVSYISGGLDSTVVLGLSSRERGYAVPSFTIGLDRAGPDERSHAAESAAALGSRLTTITLNRADIVSAYPELIRAAEGPVMDSACACLMRLAGAVHQQGYKVVLTGEGADEALAGYAWFKTQKIRDILLRRFGPTIPAAIRSLVLGMMGGDRAHLPARFPIQGVRTAQQDIYDLLAQARSFLYSGDMWKQLGDHSIYDDLGIHHDRFRKWAPLNQSLYVGYKVMLAGLLLNGKGDRVAMNSSVEARYPLLDDDVIAFSTHDRAGVQAAPVHRQVAAPPGGRTNPAGEDRQPAQDDVPRQPVRGVPRQEPSPLGRSAPLPRIARGHRLLRPRGRGSRACLAGSLPADHSQADHHGPEPHLRGGNPALAPHLLRRRPVRSASLDTRAAPPADACQPRRPDSA